MFIIRFTYFFQWVSIFSFRMDEVAWVRFKAQQHKKSAREHIVAVTHKKAQNTIGKGNPAIIGATF